MNAIAHMADVLRRLPAGWHKSNRLVLDLLTDQDLAEGRTAPPKERLSRSMTLGPQPHHFKLPLEVRAEAKRMLMAGMSKRSIMKQLGIGYSTISYILKREREGYGYFDELPPRKLAV